jgi:internalin A
VRTPAAATSLGILSAFASVLLSAHGCRPTTVTGPKAAEPYSVESHSVEVDFPDPALEDAIRKRIKKAYGPIFASDLALLGEVEMDSRGITNLSGLEYLINVHSLSLRGNFVSDLTPLSGLTSLTELFLTRNRISSIEPLVKLVGLKELRLDQNNISNIESLAGLTGLEALRLSMNPVQDFWPLGALTELKSLTIYETEGLGEMIWLPSLTDLRDLRLSWSPITNIQGVAKLTRLRVLLLSQTNISDISPLEDLKLLERLYLDRNEITDLAPLVANQGLRTDDVIWVWANPLTTWDACPHIRTLRARGATVDEDLGCR